ncbi:MAG: signal peptidase I [Anaerolineae bacterium]|nr:signal peptidase I [Anaerolineae bacterium]
MHPGQYQPEEYYWEPEPPPKKSFLKKALHIVKEVLETIIPAILIALLINLFLARATRVSGQSMEPNLHTDQRLIVEKLSYNPLLRQYLGLNGPQRGDIVVLQLDSQDELLIKRVIGLPGDEIVVRDGQVFVNGLILTEPYLSTETTGFFGPVTVPPLHVFVMGDNRNFSNDSRSFGTVPLRDIMGRAWFSYWPVDDISFVR